MLPAFLQALLPSISLQSCSPCSTEKHRWDARCGMSSLPRFHPQAFGGYLRPAERMDVVLTALEAMVDSSIYDKEVACSVMAVAMEDHAFWLSDVSTFWPLPHPRALSGVVLPSPAEVSWAPEAILSDGECSGFSGTCASGCGLFSPVSPLENADRDLHPQELEEHHRKGSAALPGLPAPPSDQPDARGGSQGPAEVLSTKRQVLSSTAWRASSGGRPAQPGLSKQSGLEGFQLWLRKPCLQCICSSALDMWEVMLCMPRTLEKVLKELTKGSQLSRLLEGVTEDTCILFLAVSYWITLCCPSGLCVPLQALTGVFVSANGKE